MDHKIPSFFAGSVSPFEEDFTVYGINDLYLDNESATLWRREIFSWRYIGSLYDSAPSGFPMPKALVPDAEFKKVRNNLRALAGNRP